MDDSNRRSNLCCATDFTEPARVAARAAARLAAKSGGELHLVHVVHLSGFEAGVVSDEVRRNERQRCRELLEAQAEEARALGARVTIEVLEGLPDEQCLLYASEHAIDTLVIAPRGERREGEWNLGSFALRVIKGARVPVLVVREEESIAEWTAGKRALRVLVGEDPSKPAQAALDWLVTWRRTGPIDVSAGCIYAPGAERLREGSSVFEKVLAASIREQLARWPELGDPRVRVLAGFGRVAEHLLELAASERADLVVVGTHRRENVERWIHGSVSLDLVATARRNVITVPLQERKQRREHPHEIRRVLVAVDFSDASTRALRWAATLLPRGGTLQLVHVVAPVFPASGEPTLFVPFAVEGKPDLERRKEELADELRRLAAPLAAERGLEVMPSVVTSFNAAEAIAAAAEQLESHLICLSTHGRTGWSRALLGSVAEGVVRRAGVPVLVVPPPHRSP